MNIEALAAKYGTDKYDHGYLPFYEKHLPEEPKRILEIGVKEGRSLAMWAEYFPNAAIHGLDLFSAISMNDVMKNVFDLYPPIISEVTLHTGNQCDWRLLEELRKLDFDIIIDDGSHNSRDQLMTFFGLFNGKHYFIEDLHCCLDDPYTQNLPFDFRANMLFSAINGASLFYPNAPKINFGADDKIICIHDK